MSSQGAQGFRPSSLGQHAALRAGTLPEPELVAEGVWAIAAPIPEGHLTHTLSYVLLDRDGRFHLIDPGWGSAANRAALERSLAVIGVSLDRLHTVVVTHHHPDHLGLAAELAAHTGARVLLSRTERAVLAHQLSPEYRDAGRYAAQLESWGVPAERRPELIEAFTGMLEYAEMEPDVLLEPGDILDLGAHTLSVLGTAGHTSGHLCFVDHDRAIVYTGDHVLPQVFSGIGAGALPGGDPLIEYLDSLRALHPLAGYEALPGHEYRFHGLVARTGDIARHHLRRTRAVQALDARHGDLTVWECASRLPWTAGWENLRGFFAHSALRQTEMHRALVRSGRLAEMLELFDAAE